MSERPHGGSLRVIGGAATARLVVESAGTRGVPVQDTDALALETARKEGFDAGHAAAREAARSRQADLEEAISRLVERLPQAWDDQLARLEEELRETTIDLAFAVAETLAQSPLLSAAAVRSAVAEALSLPLVGGEIEVRCHPADVGALQRVPPPASSGRLSFVPDAHLEPGDAWLVTPETGDLDGRLAGRLEALRKRLRDALAGDAAGGTDQ